MPFAKDLMTPEPLMLGSGSDLKDAAQFFVDHHLTTAPVQTPLGEILGMLGEVELIRALVQSHAQGEKLQKVVHAQSHFEPVTCVAETDPLSDVLRAMVHSVGHRVLVKDKQDRITGIISPKDLLRHLTGTERELTEPLKEELQKLQKEVEDLRGQLSEMSQYLQTYDTVFQSGLYMLHSVDKDGKILFANERLHQALGYEPGELIGKNIFDIYPRHVHAQAKAGLKLVMKDGKHNLTLSSMLRKNGEVIRVDLASSALRDERGRFLGTFTISRQYGSDAMLRSLHGIFDEPKEVDSSEHKKAKN